MILLLYKNQRSIKENQFYFSGQTNGNKHYKIHGQTDEPLNETGLKQAELVGQALKNIEFNQVFSSDLSRAKATCQKIIDANEASSVTLEMQETELIREKSFGQAENLHYVQFAYLTLIQNQTLPLNYVPKDGECKDDLRQRAKLFIQDILCKNVNFSSNPQHILIVSHGEFLTHFFYVLANDFQCSFTTKERDVMSKRPPNTSWCQVEVILSDSSEIQNVNCIQTWNDDHLNALKSTICNIL